jgi:hypothetical protein
MVRFHRAKGAHLAVCFVKTNMMKKMMVLSHCSGSTLLGKDERVAP